VISADDHFSQPEPVSLGFARDDPKNGRAGSFLINPF